MTKQVYICGDSFSSNDPEFDGGWVKQFESQCQAEVVNLSSPGASNYQIYLQVRQALEQNCEYLIYHATSSVRYEFALTHQNIVRDSADRYWNRSNPQQRPMVCTSWSTPENSLILTKQQADQIKNFFKSFVDLSAEIEKNYLFIQSTLDMIQKKQVPHWVWSRGGFEHKNFGSVQYWDFDQYIQNESRHNLWDHYDPAQLRPFYHVTDCNVIERVCNHYIEMLQLTS